MGVGENTFSGFDSTPSFDGFNPSFDTEFPEFETTNTGPGDSGSGSSGNLWSSFDNSGFGSAGTSSDQTQRTSGDSSGGGHENWGQF